MTQHLTSALAAIIADPDCCAASKAIARDALAQCQPQDTPQIDVDALADELTSAANIVTNGGCYEIDTDAVAQLLLRAFATHEMALARTLDALAFYAAEPVEGYFIDATVTDDGMSLKVGPVIQDAGVLARETIASIKGTPA